MGKTVAGVCETCEFDVEDGPMMGRSALVFQEPLKVGVPYTVTGEILGLVRKRSRKLGVMDVLDSRFLLHVAGGKAVLDTPNVWVFPRKELACTLTQAMSFTRYSSYDANHTNKRTGTN